jgi:hypothetical protein
MHSLAAVLRILTGPCTAVFYSVNCFRNLVLPRAAVGMSDLTDLWLSSRPMLEHTSHFSAYDGFLTERAELYSMDFLYDSGPLEADIFCKRMRAKGIPYKIP